MQLGRLWADTPAAVFYRRMNGFAGRNICNVLDLLLQTCLKNERFILKGVCVYVCMYVLKKDQ